MSISKNNEISFSKKLLHGLLEKIIFNEKDFETLKQAINDMTSGRIEPKELREKIIYSRMRILEEIIEIFPFYVEQLNNKISIDKFTTDNNNLNENTLKIEENDELLTQISYKLDTLYQKIKSKVMG